MKKQLCLLVAVIVSLSAEGQSPYRMVGGKVIAKSSRDWTVIRDRMEIQGFDQGCLLGRTFIEQDVNTGPTGGGRGNMRFAPYIQRRRVYKDVLALTNYPGGVGYSTGHVIFPPILAMRVGSVSVPGRIVSSHSTTFLRYDLFDYGVDYTPPARQFTPAEAAAAKAEASKKNSANDAVKLKFEQEQAQDGRDLYQYRMGMRYLKGEGVEKDSAKAFDYLSKSAMRDNQDAAKALAKIAAQKESAPAGKGNGL
jgi:hypothetical protein